MEKDINFDYGVGDPGKNKRNPAVEAEENRENGLQEGGKEEEEEIRDEFQCCVCLDLLYKPVVLGCGHISCFWCVYNAMNRWQESRCPVCRHSYHHFPSICQLLHFLLLKLYPTAYKGREKEVSEEENRNGCFSPQFDHQLYEQKPSEKLSGSKDDQLFPAQQQTDSCQSFHCEEGKISLARNSSEVTEFNGDGSETQPSSASTSCKASTRATSQIQQVGDHIGYEGQKRIAMTDLLCASCKNLLFRPVVLNCGHVYCESCIIVPKNETCRCHHCGSLHPNGFPSVCLILHHFFEEEFPDIYQQRREASHKQTACSTRGQQHAAQPSSSCTDLRSLCQSGNGQNVHFEVGCDCCGMTPIIGKRYKCMDCTEKMGFDLCGECFKNPAKLPGRFNQQHKPDHRFHIEEPISLPELLLSLNVVQSDVEGLDSPEHLNELASALTLSTDVPRDSRDSSHETDTGSILSIRVSLNPDDDDSDDNIS